MSKILALAALTQAVCYSPIVLDSPIDSVDPTRPILIVDHDEPYHPFALKQTGQIDDEFNDITRMDRPLARIGRQGLIEGDRIHRAFPEPTKIEKVYRPLCFFYSEKEGGLKIMECFGALRDVMMVRKGENDVEIVSWKTQKEVLARYNLYR